MTTPLDDELELEEYAKVCDLLEDVYGEEYSYGWATCPRCKTDIVLFSPLNRSVAPCDICGLLMEIWMEEAND